MDVIFVKSEIAFISDWIGCSKIKPDAGIQ